MSLDAGLLIIRTLFGLAMAAHGAQKLFGWFGGHGLKATAGGFESIGFRPGRVFAAAAGLSEAAGGFLITLGFMTPFGAAAILAAMLVAMISVHLKNGFFAANNGIEIPFLYAVAALGILFTGAGSFSLDAALGMGFVNEPHTLAALSVLAVAGAWLVLAARRHAPPQAVQN